MTDFARLVFAVETQPLQQGEQSLRSMTQTAVQTEQRTGQAMQGVSRGMRGVGAAAAIGTHGLRNVGLQLGQVTQQGAVTGNYLQALSIQMPDILMSFGMWGIGLGVVAGALSGIIPALIGSTDRIGDMDDAIEALTGTTRDYSRALDDLDLASIRDDFGSITPELIELRERLANLRLVEMMVAAGEAVDGLASRFDGFGRRAEARIADLFTTTQQFADNGGADLAAGFERTLEAINAIRDAHGLEQQLEAASGLVDLLDEIGFSTESATDEQREFYRQALESENALMLAAGAAGVLTSETGEAADEAGRLADNTERAARARQNLDQNLQLMLHYQAYGESRMDAPDDPVRHTTRRSGGGGMSEAQREHNAALREAQRIYDATRTSAEAYAEEVADLNELLEMGYLDADTHARALDQLRQQYDETAESGRGLEELQGQIKDAILDLAEGGEDAMANLASAIRRAALEALLFGEGPLANIFGTGGPGILSSLIGGFTGGGGGVSAAAGGAIRLQLETRVAQDGMLQSYVSGVSGAVLQTEGPSMVQGEVTGGGLDRAMGARFNARVSGRTR